MNLTKRTPGKDDSSVRVYFFREGVEVCLVLMGLAIAEWITHVPLWLWLLLPLGKMLTSILFYLLFVKRVLKKHPRHGGARSLIGKTAHTLVPLVPDGQVKMDGEIWAARSRTGAAIAANEDVSICEIQGMLLFVEEVQDEIRSRNLTRPR